MINNKYFTVIDKFYGKCNKIVYIVELTIENKIVQINACIKNKKYLSYEKQKLTKKIPKYLNLLMLNVKS